MLFLGMGLFLALGVLLGTVIFGVLCGMIHSAMVGGKRVDTQQVSEYERLYRAGKLDSWRNR